MDIKRNIINLVVFFFLRLPFWEALSALMLFGEMELNLKSWKVPVPNFVIYVDMGVLILLGTFMSFSSMYRCQSAQLAAIHMMFHSFLVCSFNYLPNALFYRVLLRNIGIITAYLLVAAGFGEYRRIRNSLINLVCVLLGGLFCGQAFLLMTEQKEEDLLKHLFSSFRFSSVVYEVFIPVLAICLVIASTSLIIGSRFKRKPQLFVLAYAICILFPTDVIIGFQYKPVLLWTCYRLIVSSLTTVGCVALLFFNTNVY